MAMSEVQELLESYQENRHMEVAIYTCHTSEEVRIQPEEES